MRFFSRDPDRKVNFDLLPLEYRHRYFLGVRLSVWAEIVLFYGILLFIDIFFLADNRFAHLSPHPFWIPILFTAAQYGTNAGILSALAASVLFIVGNLPILTVKYDFYDYVKDVSGEPILWFVGAVFLGEIRYRHMRERDTLREQVIELDQDSQTIAESYEDLKAVNKKLEKRVASHNKSFLKLYEASQKLENLNQSNVLSSFEEIIDILLSPRKYSLFLHKENEKTLELVQNMNWHETDVYTRIFSENDRLYKTIVDKKVFLCTLVESQQDLLKDQGILAGPIVHPQSERFFGMLKIEDIPMLELTPTGIENFKKLCQWMAVVIERSFDYEKAVESSYQNVSSHLLSSGFMDYQVDLIKKVGERFKFESSMLVFSVPSKVSLEEGCYQKIVKILNEKLKKEIRSTDLIFDAFMKDRKFTVVLVGTPLEDAQKMMTKMSDLVAPEVNSFMNFKDFHVSVKII